jgi:GNAT superfamily N-acetyltransferase
VIDGLAVEPAEARHGDALCALFERTSTPCHCQYWHFEGDKNGWLDRLFNAPEQNRTAFRDDLAQPEPKGLVALHDGQAIGWLKLTPAARVQKLYDQRIYKGLSVLQRERDGVLTVGCLLVDEAHRRRGVAKALVQGAVAYARTLGTSARAIEAFPRRTERMEPAELWTGAPSLFLDAGFVVVNDFAPYPVLRFDLSGIQGG